MLSRPARKLKTLHLDDLVLLVAKCPSDFMHFIISKFAFNLKLRPYKVDGDDDLDDMDDDAAPPSGGHGLPRTMHEIRARGPAASVRESYVVDLSAELGVCGVRDVAFLHGRSLHSSTFRLNLSRF